MASPLLPYANAYLLFEGLGVPEMVDGKVVFTSSASYVVLAYLKRQESTGVRTGKQDDIGGVVYLRRGYALRYWEVASGFAISGVPTGTFTEMSNSVTPDWMRPGRDCLIRPVGRDAVWRSTVETSTGKFENSGIDLTISGAIQGVPITLSVGELI